LQNSPLESSCVVVALIEKCSTSKALEVSPEKSHILSGDTLIANERGIPLYSADIMDFSSAALKCIWENKFVLVCFE
jgi:hypothetical protein